MLKEMNVITFHLKLFLYGFKKLMCSEKKPDHV